MLANLAELFISAFPRLDNTGQQQALLVYKLLAKGHTIRIEQLAQQFTLSTAETQSIVNNWTGVSYTNDGDIDGFWGLSIQPTSHKFILNDVTLYTWCAWDLLFMPIIFKQTIDAETQCPLTEKTISLTISQTGIKNLSPADAQLTFLQPSSEQLDKDIIGNFCQYVFFIATKSDAASWIKQHSGHFLVSADEGFLLGKSIMQKVFSL